MGIYVHMYVCVPMYMWIYVLSDVNMEHVQAYMEQGSKGLW